MPALGGSDQGQPSQGSREAGLELQSLLETGDGLVKPPLADQGQGQAGLGFDGRRIEFQRLAEMIERLIDFALIVEQAAQVVVGQPGGGVLGQSVSPESLDILVDPPLPPGQHCQNHQQPAGDQSLDRRGRPGQGRATPRLVRRPPGQAQSDSQQSCQQGNGPDAGQVLPVV